MIFRLKNLGAGYILNDSLSTQTQLQCFHKKFHINVALYLHLFNFHFGVCNEDSSVICDQAPDYIKVDSDLDPIPERSVLILWHYFRCILSFDKCIFYGYL